MRIEAGKTYRTRHGKRARIFATDLRKGYPIIGAVSSSEGGDEIVTTWKADGLYQNSGGDNDHDIVGEWREPLVGTRAYYACPCEAGTISLMNHKPAPKDGWLGFKRVEITVKEGDDR